MPVKRTPHAELRLIEFSGVVTEEEIVAFWRQSLEEGYEGAHTVVDLSNVTRLDIAAGGAARVASLIRQKSMTPHRVAIVASTPLMFGISRVYEGNSSTGSAEIHVFRSYEPAVEWALTGRLTDDDAGSGD